MKTRKKHNGEDKMDEEDKMEFKCIGQKHLKTVSWTMNLPFCFWSFKNIYISIN